MAYAQVTFKLAIRRDSVVGADVNSESEYQSELDTVRAPRSSASDVPSYLAETTIRDRAARRRSPPTSRPPPVSVPRRAAAAAFPGSSPPSATPLGSPSLVSPRFVAPPVVLETHVATPWSPVSDGGHNTQQYRTTDVAVSAAIIHRETSPPSPPSPPVTRLHPHLPPSTSVRTLEAADAGARCKRSHPDAVATEQQQQQHRRQQQQSPTSRASVTSGSSFSRVPHSAELLSSLSSSSSPLSPPHAEPIESWIAKLELRHLLSALPPPATTGDESELGAAAMDGGRADSGARVSRPERRVFASSRDFYLALLG